MNRRGENWSEKGRKTRRLTLLCNLMNTLQSPRLACRIGRKLAHHVAGDHKTWYSVVSAEEKKWKGRISFWEELGRMWLWGTKLGWKRLPGETASKKKWTAKRKCMRRIKSGHERNKSNNVHHDLQFRYSPVTKWWWWWFLQWPLRL